MGVINGRWIHKCKGAGSYFTGLFFLLCLSASSQGSYDSLRPKRAKHYFNTLISLDSYRKPNRTFTDTSTYLAKRLKSYGIRQAYLTFQIPLATIERVGKDSSIQNSHFLLTGNFLSLRPTFDGLEDHNLVKFGVGLRYIYNSGKKGVWFVDVSPFVTRDNTFPSKAFYRMASTIVYSHNSTASFNWRIGLTKSFLWGNRLYLPFVGLRIGRLDKLNLSIQFPRSVHLSMPLSPKVIFSLYSRPQGGLFLFSNRDSLYYKTSTETFQFSRYELNSGFRFDFRFGSHVALYIASGISSRNTITFYSESANARRVGYYSTYFFSKKVRPTLFFNLGLVLKFGKTRSYYNNKSIYDAIDLNNTNGPNNGNLQIPLSPEKKKSDFNLKSVEDLVDYNDF